jgi:hypothetical protein
MADEERSQSDQEAVMRPPVTWDQVRHILCIEMLIWPWLVAATPNAEAVCKAEITEWNAWAVSEDPNAQRHRASQHDAEEEAWQCVDAMLQVVPAFASAYDAYIEFDDFEHGDVDE